jgi:hypothetical protein
MRIIVWLLRRYYGCGHLGPAVRYCYCDLFRRRHLRQDMPRFEELS